MSNTDFQITSKQLIFLIVGTILGSNFLTLPRVICTYSKQDAWIAVIVGALVPVLSLLLIERLGRRFPEMDFTAMSLALFGKILGTILVVLFNVHLILSVARVIFRFAFLDKLYLLPNTPIWVICLIIVVGCFYIASKGAKVIARLNEFMFYILLPLFLLFVPPLVTGGDLTNILPVGGSGVSSIAEGSFHASTFYGRIEFLMVAYFMVTRKDEVLKAGFAAIAILVFTFVVILVASLLVFGSDLPQSSLWPLLALFKSVRLPGVERMDLFFLGIWSVAFRPAFNLMTMSAYTITKLFQSQKYNFYPVVLVVISTIAFLLTFIPKNVVDLLEYTQNFGYTYPFMAIGFPLLYHLAAAVRGKQVNQNA